MTTTPHIGIIVLNWNGIDNTRRCLTSLQKITYSNYSIFLVDNGSTINESDVLKKEYREIIAIRTKNNLGFSGGNNIGIKYALYDSDNYCDYILILNNDTVVENNFLSIMVRTAIQDNSVGMVSPTMLSMNNHNTIDNMGLCLTLSGIPFNRKKNKRILLCPSGGAALYSRQMLKDICLDGDYFDSTFFAYAEDYDIGMRALQAGYKPAHANNAIIYHKGSASTGLMSDFAIYHTYRNLLLVIVKDWPFLLLVINAPWIILMQICLIFLHSKRGTIHILLNAYRDFFKYIPQYIKMRNIIRSHKQISSIVLLRYFEKRVVLLEYIRNAIYTNGQSQD